MNRPVYPEQINLPFNFAMIRDAFRFHPDSRQAPAGTCVWILLQGNGVLMLREGTTHVFPTGELPAWCSPFSLPLCIGSWHGTPVCVAAVSSDTVVPEAYRVAQFNARDDEMDHASLTLAGLGKQILHWERQSRFCSRCGSPAEAIAATWGKRCSSCKAEHFPHLHPCAIVLVRRNNQLLLTRKAEWAPGRYGLVAGFVDFGESLEECAMREVREETGIDIRNVRYLGSQNWPFPAQIMAGFIADYAGGEILIDTTELEDARWFPLDALPALPPPRSIARWIIDNSISTTPHPI